MRFGPSAVLFTFILLASTLSCGRKPASLEAVDQIDRRTNVPMEPISRDLAKIREQGFITVAGKGTEKAIKPGPADPVPEIDLQARLVTRPAQLAGRRVDLPERSPFRRTLLELSDEISGDIYVVEVGGEIADEALAQKVARGEVQFTVMQKNLADLKEAEFKNLKVRPILGQMQKVSWAVRKNSPELLATLNTWIARQEEDAAPEESLSEIFCRSPSIC